MQRTLGVCYYPEHWPRDIWEEDARRMAAAGLTWVRIGEFAWSRLEPQPGAYDFTWLDEAIQILGAAGLKVVLGTPTATPPRWILDRYPDMLALDAEGRPRKFGSRRHYCFSHEGYKRECVRIVEQLAQRYGHNPHIAAWQTDNEYGCHDTTLSYSDAACDAFRLWLRCRYPGQDGEGDINALNTAWGNIFWSMEYQDFAQIELPNLTVTEANPAHVLDFRRFSSDQVVAFNHLQVDIIRAHTDAPVTHNFMGRTTDFDHFTIGRDLDFASWDSYPLGFLEDRVPESDEYKQAYARQGDPDFQAFHHDLYRAVGQGRWWVMEQQPGPVNWAPYNPAPLPGMVRLWTWEAFAHGAEAVCYFRWRQAPMAQEQMHAGLLRPDSVAAPGLAEAETVARELADTPEVTSAPAEVALLFDYQADWMWDIKPHGRGLNYFDLVLENYRALRRLGLSIDMVSSGADFSAYKLIVVPGLMHLPESLLQALDAANAVVVTGPRSGALTENFAIPLPLPPQIPALDIVVSGVESLRPDMPVLLKSGGEIRGYREYLQGSVESDAETIEWTEDDEPVVVASQRSIYVGGWLDTETLQGVMQMACRRAGVDTLSLPEGLRCRKTGVECFWFNYSNQAITFQGSEYLPRSVTRRRLTDSV
ncbi:MAG: beta-galactosidase [Thiolinea sp.]